MIFSDRLFMLSIAIAVFVFIYVIYLVRNRMLLLRYSLVWIFASLGFLTIAVFPESLQYVTRLSGIRWPIHTLFFAGILFLLIMLLILTHAISKKSEAIKNISHEIAILKNMIKKD